ncbi:MAG TPA: hypothetical protein VGD78_13645, partial [Chthoniobacterales bacterium]
MPHHSIHSPETDAILPKSGRTPWLTGPIRRWFAVFLLLAAAPFGAGSRAHAAGPGNPAVLRIGYQKFNTLNLLKAKGALDDRLRREGVRVEWLQFGSGPLLFEAFNANSLDFGHAADAPTAFAQAAGIPFVYVAAEPAYPRGLALL